jgi:ketol-acid reductoisomerase
MKVAAYDPFLTEERAVELGVEKVELDELLKRADVITLHVPLTEQTKQYPEPRKPAENQERPDPRQLRPRRPCGRRSRG